MACANAADFLVGSEDDAESVDQLRLGGSCSEDAGEKTLDVACAAAVQMPVPDEGIESAIPIWREGHRVSVAHENQVGIMRGDVLSPRGRDEVQFFDLLRIPIRHGARGPAQAVQDVGGVFDYRAIRSGRVRCDPDQLREVLDGGGHRVLVCGVLQTRAWSSANEYTMTSA